MNCFELKKEMFVNSVLVVDIAVVAFKTFLANSFNTEIGEDFFGDDVDVTLIKGGFVSILMDLVLFIVEVFV